MASNPNKGIINNFWLLLVLGLLYSFFLWLGYDRLPLLPVSGDGPLIQDPALALARGQGLRAPSFGSTLNFESLYAHHPPVYIYLQSCVIRWLGLSPLSLRGTSLLAAILALAAWIACFGLLLRLGWLDRVGFWLCSLLYLFEPMLFSLARWERMDSLVNLLVAGSLLFLLLIMNQSRQPARNWLGFASALLLGLALSTHLGAVAAWLVWVCLVCALRQRFSRRHPILLILLPVLIFFTIWLLTYQESSLAAFRQLWTISSHHTGGWFAYLRAFFSSFLGPRQFLQAAPLAGFVVLAGWLLLTVVLLKQSRQKPENQSPEYDWLRLLWLGLALSLIFTLFVSGFNPKHLVILFPFALIAAGMALKHSGAARLPLQKIILVVAACLLFTSLVIQAATILTLFTGWNERSPERFMKLSAEIPRQARVAAVPDFWYFFQSMDQPVRLVDYGFPEDRAYWEAHAASELLGFDYVILYPDHPLSGLAASLSRQQQELSFGSASYILYTIK